MRESAGKRTARELFYNDCLPGWLSLGEIQASNFLTLLGEEGLELPLLDELGVPRNRVWSVERELPVYNKQNKQHWGVSLYYGEATEYLERMLHSNQQFKVLVLDIEGSHIAQLDHAMESIVLYAWRNAKTVVATYSSIGRDTRTLFEGIVSLAVFLALSEEHTRAFVAIMHERYQRSGFVEPLRMVLRDLFWMRSILEGVYSASSAIGVSKRKEVRSFFKSEGAFWNTIVKGGKGPLNVRRLLTLSQAWKANFAKGMPKTSLHVDDVYTLMYRAQPPWSHAGRFVRFGVHESESLTPNEWIERLMERYAAAETTFIKRDGEVEESMQPVQQRDVLRSNLVLWDRDEIWSFVPRTPNGSTHVRVSSVATTVKMIRENRHVSRTPQEGVEDMGRASGRLIFVDKSGKLTDYAKEMIKKLGGGRKLSPDERASLSTVAPNGVLEQSVAVSGRQRKLDTEEVCALLPRGVDRRSVTACIAIGRRKRG